MRIAIVSATVAVITGLLVYTFGLIPIVNIGEAAREIPAGRYVVAAIAMLIYLPPAFVLVRLATPKNEVVFGESALTIKARGEQKSIAYVEIGSMVLEQFLSSQLALYDRAGQPLHWFKTGTDKATLSSIVRLLTERITFDARTEHRATRYVRR